MVSLLATILLSTSFALKPGDRVVFYGDSITEQQVYTSFVETFVRTRYPGLNVTFHGRGWSGDSTWGGGGGGPDQRVNRDVKPFNPTVITVMLGMNDGGYVPFDQKIYDTFDDWYGKLLGFMHKDAPNARYTLIRTCPWDAITRDLPASFVDGKWEPWAGYNDVLQRFGKVVEKHAAAEKGLYVDFNQPLVDVLKRANAIDRKGAQQIIPDGIHPGPAGGLVMAIELVKAWGASPLVSDVSLDAFSKAVSRSENAMVTHWNGQSWDELEGSLPFCVDPDNKTVQLALGAYDEAAKFNQEYLTVIGLAGGSYELRIDGALVGKFSAEALGGGINLSVLGTPMRKQSLEVLDLVRRRCDFDFAEWRKVEVDHGAMKHAAAAAKAMKGLEGDIVDAEMAACKPVVHHFELKKVG